MPRSSRWFRMLLIALVVMTAGALALLMGRDIPPPHTSIERELQPKEIAGE